MENLFLEILRVIDLKIHNRNTDFYYFPLGYFRLIMENKEITTEDLINIYKNIPENVASLFSASKIEVNKKVLRRINFDYTNIYFYKGRELLFFICYFLKFSMEKTIKLDVEKDFFSFEDDYDFISTFDFFLNHSLDKKSIIEIYHNLDSISEKYTDIIKNNFLSEKKFEFKLFDVKNPKLKFFSDFKNAIILYLNNNNLEIGVKELNYHTFETQIFYIMVSILSLNISTIDLSKMYLNIQKI